MSMQPSTPPRGNRKTLWIILAGGGVAAFAIYRYEKKNSANAAAASAATTASTSYDPNAIDPATGLTYGDEASGAYQDYSGAYNTATGAVSGSSGYYDPSTGQYIPYTGGTPTATSTSPTNNQQWTQAAEAYLSAEGYDPATVLAALGAYLASVKLTAQQQTIVQSAIAAVGPPPTGVGSGVSAQPPMGWSSRAWPVFNQGQVGSAGAAIPVSAPSMLHQPITLSNPDAWKNVL